MPQYGMGIMSKSLINNLFMYKPIGKSVTNGI